MATIYGIEIGSTNTERFRSNLSWNWTDRGVIVKDGGLVVCEIGTRFPSRDGLKIIDAIREVGEGYRVQTTDHGCGRKSVQVFSGSRLASEVIVNG